MIFKNGVQDGSGRVYEAQVHSVNKRREFIFSGVGKMNQTTKK